jgi:hypothetical protein
LAASVVNRRGRVTPVGAARPTVGDIHAVHVDGHDSGGARAEICQAPTVRRNIRGRHDSLPPSFRFVDHLPSADGRQIRGSGPVRRRPLPRPHDAGRPVRAPPAPAAPAAQGRAPAALRGHRRERTAPAVLGHGKLTGGKLRDGMPNRRAGPPEAYPLGLHNRRRLDHRGAHRLGRNRHGFAHQHHISPHPAR